MDSKQKFIKNRKWKRKYQPRNAAAAAACSLKKTEQKNENDQSEESEDDTLKQPVPEGGWFPEHESSSSDLEDFESLTYTQHCGSTSISKSHIIKKDDSCDKNWFDKELDNIQITSEVSAVKKDENIKKHVNKDETNKEKKCQSSNSKIQGAINKNNFPNTNDNEEEELEFLLSLKEPVHTGPLIIKKNIENDRKLTIPNHNLMNQKPVKTNDLDKWLDSILDD